MMIQSAIKICLPLFIACLCITNVEAEDVTITVVYNNVPCRQDLTTAWGFSCLVEGTERTILFDTGGDGAVLMRNMRKLQIDPAKVEAVVLSHIHGDHVGGLGEFLGANPNVRVFVPASFPHGFQEQIKKRSREVIPVHKPTPVCRDAWSTGQLGLSIKEQSLVILHPKGLSVITGCAHPGIVRIVKHAKNYFNRDVYCVLGGFHLMGISESRMTEIVNAFRRLGVKKVGPSHCTGEGPIQRFRKEWGQNFLESGCGARFTIGD